MPHGECACGDDRVRDHNDHCVECDASLSSKYEAFSEVLGYKECGGGGGGGGKDDIYFRETREHRTKSQGTG